MQTAAPAWDTARRDTRPRRRPWAAAAAGMRRVLLAASGTALARQAVSGTLAQARDRLAAPPHRPLGAVAL